MQSHLSQVYVKQTTDRYRDTDYEYQQERTNASVSPDEHRKRRLSNQTSFKRNAELYHLGYRSEFN